MSKVSKYISDFTVEEIRNNIQEAHGNEVFFIGKLNSDRLVEQVKPIARGNEFAVPIVRQYAESCDVVIHNHPSGVLKPSDNDLYISSQLGEIGISSYIINNDVTEIYVIIEPFEKEQIKFLNIDKISAILAPKGSVSRTLPGYEFRPQQIEMIKKIADAFNKKKIAVIEAGTGVGKTLAYLIPAIYWAVNNRERCAVSTNTINLQEQIIYKDIPFLQSVLNIKFTAVLVKGRNNYVCLRKINSLQKELNLLIDVDEADQIQTLIEWSKNTSDGSKSDLNFIPKSEVWEKVAAESDTCLRAKCSFFKSCFVNIARRKANNAHIIVVNHHLLFSDLSVRNMGIEVAVLPPYKRLILDEAHHIEDVASNYLGAGITRAGITRILNRFYRKKENKEATGYLSLLAYKLKILLTRMREKEIEQALLNIESDLIPQIINLESLNQETMDMISGFIFNLKQDEFGEIKRRITSEFKDQGQWDATIQEKASDLIFQIKKFGSDLSRTISLLESFDIGFENEEFEELFFEIAVQRNRLLGVCDTIHQVLFDEDEKNIRWLEVRARTSSDITRLKICPLDISNIMEEIVYNRFKTIVMTSATLTVAGGKGKSEFDYFINRIGLNLIEPDRLTTTIFPPSFNYQKQVIVGIPLDIPTPEKKEFSESIEQLILKSVVISNGRAFILFTSYGLLNLIYARIESQLTGMGFNVLKQGAENRHVLLEKFKQDKTSILFATDSFWEGVDVQGEALESVIITKLPFKVPTEPVVEARVEAIQKKGGNPFLEYSVPQAVIKLKQGFGRLIRSNTDRGSILILDKRIIEKYYGKIFIASLPNGQLITGEQNVVFQKIKQFFENNTYM